MSLAQTHPDLLKGTLPIKLINPIIKHTIAATFVSWSRVALPGID